MLLLENLNAGVEGLRRNLMRSLLSGLGIVIAVAAVVIVFSFGEQSKSMITQELERKWGVNLIIVNSVRPPRHERRRHQSWKNLLMEDLEMLRNQLPEASLIGGYREAGSFPIKIENQAIIGQIKETDPAYLSARKREVVAGRSLNWEDEAQGAKVCIIGPELAETLFGSQQAAIGKEILFNNQRFVVVGTVDAKTPDIGNSEFAKDVYIPLNTGTRRFSATNPLDEIVIKVPTPTLTENILARTMELLYQRHQQWDFTAVTEEERAAGMQRIVFLFQIILGLLSGVSLIVGGIVVMNMMLVSVTERTREIGLRKALGARRRDIITQFLSEAVLLCLLSGIAGMAVGLFASKGFQWIVPIFNPSFRDWPDESSPATVLLAMLCSFVVGTISGTYPAWRAAKLDATQALRYE